MGGLDGALVGDHRFDGAITRVGAISGDDVEHLGVGRHVMVAYFRALTNFRVVLHVNNSLVRRIQPVSSWPRNSLS